MNTSVDGMEMDVATPRTPRTWPSSPSSPSRTRSCSAAGGTTPAAASTAFRLSNALRTCASSSGSGEPSSRLPTWPDTNSKSPERTAAE